MVFMRDRLIRVAACAALVVWVAACGGGGGSNLPSGAAPSPVDPGLAPAVAYRGSVILASPTRDSVRINLYAPDQSGVVWLNYGTSSNILLRQTAKVPLTAGQALEIQLTGLQPATQHFYSLNYSPNAQTAASTVDAQGFYTAREPGNAFVFALQGDSHPERQPLQFNPELYQRTLDTAAADKPDFYILMGDDFSVDTLDPLKITKEQVVARYTLQRAYLGRIGKSAPLFLVNGNHEQTAGYMLDGTAENVAVWAQNARIALYSPPAPDSFYSGNTQSVPNIGLLRNYFSWTWGDALFAVIDPYWPSQVPVDNVFGGSNKIQHSMWEVSHGNDQYQWLKQTLAQSKARYKFVFAHHVMGTGRGGIELAGLWEWGGRSSKGVMEFPTQRPTWERPIHQLMVDNKVTIFFQGHDHLWVRQQLDGVTYQTVSEPADANYALYFSDAYTSGDKFSNSGYTRVSVASSGVKVEYVRSVLPADEKTQGNQGSVVFSYNLP